MILKMRPASVVGENQQRLKTPTKAGWAEDINKKIELL
jgi:hypothetical protein